jgi:nicotinamide mononucleotide transporter
MSAFGIIAFVTGILGVWLTIKQSILCWPAALISVVTSSIDFFNARLFGDMSLQVFYFFAGLYGWIYWKEHAKQSFVVSHVPVSSVMPLGIVTLIQIGVYYFLLKSLDGARPFLDSVLTAASLTTTYMMTKKWVENWLIWVIIDSFYVILYAITDLGNLWLYALLYLIFALVAFYGWLKWRRQAYAGSV